MVVVEIGYNNFALSKEDAMTIVEILERAELYEAKYWSTDKRKEKGMTADYTYHVYPNEKQYTMKIISNDMYNMAKLAGKPERD